MSEPGWVEIAAEDIRIGVTLCIIGTPSVTLVYKKFNGIASVLTDDGLHRQWPCSHKIKIKEAKK